MIITFIFSYSHIMYAIQVLQPYVNERGGSLPSKMLLMDSLRAHWVSSVKEKLDNFGFRTQKVPGGMTFLCQPVDVGIAKPFKDAIKERWANYMIAQCHLNNGTGSVFAKPTREIVAKWVKDVWEELPATIIKSSWRHAPYNLL